MFGWINDCCESLVVTKFGIGKWHEVKAIAGCTVEDGGFIRHQYYTDESSVELVVAVSKVLGISVDAVLESFGQYFMEFTRKAGFGNLLSCQGSNLKLWLSNLNALHDHLQDTLPRGRFPEFWCEDDAEIEGSILLHYYSERGSLFVPFVVGLVKEIAHFHFSLQVVLVKLQTQGENEAGYTSWRITTLDPIDMHKLTANVGWAPETSDFEDTLRDADISNATKAAGCPFHTMERESKKQVISEKAAERFWSRSIENDNKRPIEEITINLNEGRLDAEASTEEKELQSEKGETKPFAAESFISNEKMKEMFPFHLVVDANFKVLQAGNNLDSLLGIKSENATLIGRLLQDLFEIKRPVLGKWDWNVIDQFQQQTFYFASKINDLKRVYLKAHFIHLSDTPKYVFLALSPDAKNIRQLRKMDLTMSDLPIYSFQRDAIFLGEHMLSGIRSSHKLDKLSRKLASEHTLSNTLLYSMLPQNVAQILRSGRTFEPTHHENVTLFFSDVVGFTDMCSELPPWDIIDMLNRLYTVMDYLAAKFNLYKVETIGDAYMCCSGLPEPNEFHAEDVVNFALAVRSCVSLVKSPLTNKPIRVRIGIHSGSCMSGVVGTLTPHYCLFGDMINTTSRHESTGKPQMIHCSSVTYELLGVSKSGSYSFTPRGLVDMKGKGKLFTYWLDSATEENPYVGPKPLKNIVNEVQHMLKQKTWRKRSYFPKRGSDSTNTTSNLDQFVVDSSLGHEPISGRHELMIDSNPNSSRTLGEEVYIENKKELENLRSSIANAGDDVIEDDLSVQIRRMSMLGGPPMSPNTNGSTDSTSGTEEHEVNSSYHHLHTQSQYSRPSSGTEERGVDSSYHHLHTHSQHSHSILKPQSTSNAVPNRKEIEARVSASTKRERKVKILPTVKRDKRVRNQSDVFHRLWSNAVKKADSNDKKRIHGKEKNIMKIKSVTESSNKKLTAKENKKPRVRERKTLTKVKEETLPSCMNILLSPIPLTKPEILPLSNTCFMSGKLKSTRINHGPKGQTNAAN